MGKSLLGAFIGALVGAAVAGTVIDMRQQTARGGPRQNLWASVLESELKLAHDLDHQGLSTVAALAEELHWLRRQQARNSGGGPTWLQKLTRPSAATTDSEANAVDFMLQQVSGALNAQLDEWQKKMDVLNNVDPTARAAALRILAFAKWQQRGGEYVYAHEFLDQLTHSNAAPPPPRRIETPTAVPTHPLATATPRSKRHGSTSGSALQPSPTLWPDRPR